MLTRTFLSLSFFEAFMSIVIRYWCKERPSRIPLKGGWSHKHLPHNAVSTTRQQSLLLCKKVPGKAVFLGHPNKNHWSFFKQTGGQYWDTKKVSPKRKSKFTKALASNICNFLRQATFLASIQKSAYYWLLSKTIDNSFWTLCSEAFLSKGL